LCSLVFGLFCANLARAAEPEGILRDFVVRTWSKADGLPDNSVTTLLQTRDGYLWVGTVGGLARFDGVRFVPLPLTGPPDYRPVSITGLCEDTTGSLWIGSQEQGLVCWRGGTAKHYGKADGLLDEGITSLAADSGGHVWIGTRHGLNRWDGWKFTGFTTNDGLPDDAISAVHVARSGAVWITTHGGMCRWLGQRLEPFNFPASESERDQILGAYEDVRGNLWAFCATYIINLAKGKRMNYLPGEKSASIRNWSLCEGRGGRLWIGASGRGVFCFDGTAFQPIMLNEGRWPNDVRTIYEDQEGSLWLGTPGGGLTQLIPQSIVLLKANQGLPPGAATSIMLDAGGRICVGMESGGLYASIGERFEKVSDETRTLGQVVPTSLCASPDGTLWVGTFGAGLYQLKDGRTALCTTANGLSDDTVLAVCSDSECRVWAGTLSGELHRFANGELASYAREGGLPGAAITALLPAHDGGLWIGTGNGVLLRSDSDFKRTSTVTVTPGLSGKPILGLCETADGKLWLGSGGGGLGCLDATGCSSWTTQQGLPDDVVLGLMDDSEGNLWMNTSKGLCRLPRAAAAKAMESSGPGKAKLVFETETGANSSLNFGWPRALRSADGRLWFATGSGLVGIDTRSWQPERPAPQVQIESVLADNRSLKLPARPGSGREAAQPLQLPAKFRALEFQFTALSFEAPEKVRFRHKLERFDSGWIETGTQRHIAYGQLPSGQYEFRVTACNAEGVWNDTGAVLAFVIPTPLWRSSLFLGLYGLAAAGGVAGTVRVVSHRRLRKRLTRLEQQQAMERERMRIAQDMHDEIGSKLTKISFLSELAKGEIKAPGALAEKVDSIAGTSRDLLKALDEIVWAVNPRNDTLEQLCAYLSQYAREYFKNTAVECTVNLQPDLPRLAMSAELRHNLFLAFEESLNNVLKHSGASMVRVDIQVKDECLKISVADNGRGFELQRNADASSARNGAAAGAGTTVGDGLVNMHQRLAEVGGRFAIESRVRLPAKAGVPPGTGTPPLGGRSQESNASGTSVTLSVGLNSAKVHDS
jgi:ligand-binding sensor domain-containing protein/signal transduction histidine kinase